MAEHFTYRVSWSEEDGEHVGTCLEFPGLSHLASDPAAALDGIRGLVADVVAEMKANAEPVPEPLTHQTQSPLVGVCRSCDFSAVRPWQWGKRIEGEVCLGCGGPVYELVCEIPGGAASKR